MADFRERILHVDMDAFFVEVERLDDPSLVGVPVVVGGGGARGVVAAASYEARERGVHSAMPMVEARRRCPQARVVTPSHARYGEISSRVFDVLRRFTPLVEGLSADEAFLDISGLRLHHESPQAVGSAIREAIRSELHLPASAGGSTTKFVAKLASEDAKPDGMLIVPAGEELSYLEPMLVRRLWGVGQATLAALDAMGIATVGELAKVAPAALQARLGRSLGHHLHELANARDSRPVEPGTGARSISVEATYESDLRSDEEIERALLRHCDRLSARLRRAGVAGHTVGLKLRFGDFRTVSRSETVAVPVEHTPELWDLVRGLLARVDLEDQGIRLLGVVATGLVPSLEPRQLSLDRADRSAAAAAAAAVRERFGDDAVFPARLIEIPRDGANDEPGDESPLPG